jgi:2-keto-4-pentenoate hydratase
MDAASARAAAALLWKTWQSGQVLDNLPESCRPRDAAEGFAVQTELVRVSGQEVSGWKIAATSAAGQRHLDVPGPLGGRLLEKRVLPHDATLSLAGNRMRVAEPEFVFRLGRDLPARSTPYPVAEVMAAVDALLPGLEVPDSRYARYAGIGAGPLLADNACAHWFVLGSPAPERWRELDLAAYPATILRDGAAAAQGIGSNVLGDPRAALAWLANELHRFGEFLRAGQIVTTGTCATPLPLEPGHVVAADFGELGSVRARFVA